MAINLSSLFTVGGRTTSMSTPAATPDCCLPVCCGLECLDRTRFFAGQLLTERDLNHEQAYFLAKNRLHNRYLHGWGVVCGMQVVCSECDGWVTVKSGYAIDPCGNDIIVCQDYAFNLMQAIQNCCAPAPVPNCAPLRYVPSPSCQDLIQTWCITIQYQEQQSRMVTPLMQVPGGMNGCSTSVPSSACCPPAPSQTSSNPPVGACEATRILEGFQLGVIPAPPQPTQKGDRKPSSLAECLEGVAQPGTFQYQFCQCLVTLLQLIAQKPTPQSPYQKAYQSVMSYLATVQNALSSSFVTHCRIEETLAAIGGRIPAPTDPKADLGVLNAALTEISDLITRSLLDCLCTSLIPPCSPAPCDNRLILACVTVQNGRIQDICHFGGRRQVVTFPTLYYWLSLLGFDNYLEEIVTLLQNLCCSDPDVRKAVFATAPEMQTRDVVTGAGASNAGMAPRMVMDFIKQKLGASAVNAINPANQTVDLRPYVGTTLPNFTDRAFVNTSGPDSALSSSVITRKDVTNDPAWSDEAVAASARFTPSAFVPGRPLTVYFKGNLIVGFDETNPADQIASLQATVASLQSTVTNLQTTVNTLQNPKSTPQQPKGGSNIK